MPATERRFWPRPEVHQHVLGEIKIIYVGEAKIRALMLYEQSVERDAIPEEMPPLRGRLVGEMDDIHCTICGRSVGDWLVGEDAMMALLSRVLTR